jgi:hypothetical protein
MAPTRAPRCLGSAAIVISPARLSRHGLPHRRDLDAVSGLRGLIRRRRDDGVVRVLLRARLRGQTAEADIRQGVRVAPALLASRTSSRASNGRSCLAADARRRIAAGAERSPSEVGTPWRKLDQERGGLTGILKILLVSDALGALPPPPVLHISANAPIMPRLKPMP